MNPVIYEAIVQKGFFAMTQEERVRACKVALRGVLKMIIRNRIDRMRSEPRPQLP